MKQRRKTYIVRTKLVTIRTYELLASDVEEAKALIRNGYRAGLISIDESFNVEGAYRKEHK